MFGTIASIAGGLISGLGGGKETSATSAPSSGFAVLPKEVQKAWLETYLPDVMKNYDQPRTPIPLIRAKAPETPFDSAELWNLQQFSDKVGGYFSPKGKHLNEVYPPGQAPAADNSAATNATAASTATTYASLLNGMAGSGSKTVASRILNLPADQQAELGKMIDQVGGLDKALKSRTQLNNLFAAKFGMSIF